MDKTEKIVQTFYEKGMMDEDNLMFIHESIFTDVAKEISSISEWVSIKDELPEDGEYKLCLFEYDGELLHSILYYVSGDEQWIDLDLDVILNVTHWQPLPSKPKTN